jgi:hypothetical protein
MNEAIRLLGSMRDVTPGKWELKKDGTELGSFSRVVKWAEGRKSVQVNEPSYFWLELFKLLVGLLKTHKTGDSDEHELLPRPDM